MHVTFYYIFLRVFEFRKYVAISLPINNRSQLFKLFIIISCNTLYN